jgi:O-antigen ligase
MRFRSVVVAYTVWLWAIFGVFYLVHGNDGAALQVTVMLGAIPAVLQILLLGIDWRGLVAPAKLWLALLLVILLSYLVNVMDPVTAPSGIDDLAIPAAWMPIIYTFNVLFILAVATVFAGCPDRRLLRSVAGLFCVMGAPFLIYIDITGERIWGRLSANDLQPNMWGLAGLTVCLGAFARKPGLLAVGGFIVGAATILEASSRESLVAIAVALLVVIGLHLQDTTRPRLVVMLAGAGVALVLTALLLDPYIINAIGYISSDVFLLDSPERGLDSGFSGRSGVWAATIEVWLKSPLIGIGFRRHEQFLPDEAPAHNAFLAMLADTGLAGLLVYLVLLVGSLIAAWGIRDPRTRRFVLAVIVAYIMSGFFDRRTINGGNPYSLFFLICCSVALVDQSLRNAALKSRERIETARELFVRAAGPTQAR